MENYIDGFVFPIAKMHLENYINIASKVAQIWKQHGALSYVEYVKDETKMEGTKTFSDLCQASKEELVILGWVTFESRESRDKVLEQIMNDQQLQELVAPLVDPKNIIFDSARMAYGGFSKLV